MIPWPLIEQSKAIIFDCDGTLVDSMPVHFLAWTETMRRYGIDFGEERFYALGGVPSHRIISMLCEEQNKVLDPIATAHEKEQAFLDRIHMLEPIAPVMDVVRHARGKKPIAVASGGFRSIVMRQLEQVGISDWFDTIVAAEDTHKHKPEPDVFLETAKRLRIPPTECIVFEDADLGVEAAHRAGMQCVDVRHFFQPRRLPVPPLP